MGRFTLVSFVLFFLFALKGVSHRHACKIEKGEQANMQGAKNNAIVFSLPTFC